MYRPYCACFCFQDKQREERIVSLREHNLTDI